MDKVNYHRLYEALEIVGMREKINKLPQKLNTNLFNEKENSGTGFSKGELQRLAIARTLYTDSSLVIADECFSYCDKELRKKKFEIIDKLAEKKKVVYISHQHLDETKFDKVISLN